jgi:hypothetical protein
MFDYILVWIHKLTRKLRFITALKVHCWGGLGSQLFAVAVYFQLKNRFPKRSVILVLHDGGVTKRISEIEGIFSEINTMQIHDFSNPAGKELTNQKRQKFVLRLIKGILKKFHVVLTLDSGDGFQSVLPWTLSIRGHYSYRRIRSNTVALLLSRLSPSGKDRLQKNLSGPIQVGIHYRLGDLLTLENKSYVSHEKIISVIQDLSSRHKLNRCVIRIHSDSPKVASQKLSPLREKFTIQQVEQNPWETLSALLQYKSLVVTNSKIGIWAIIFKVRLGLPHLMIAPKEMKSDLTLILGSDIYNSKIEFY